MSNKLSSRILCFVVFFLFALLILQNNSYASEKKIIGVATFVDHRVLNSIRDSFVSELTLLGYSEKNGWKVIEKNANGNTVETNQVASELINLRPKVIVSISTPSTKAVFEANKGRLPLVYSFVSFPDKIGITEKSPNITGLSDGVDFQGNFNLMKRALGKLKSIGMVYSDEPNAIVSMENMSKICRKEGVKFVGQIISSDTEVRQATEAICQLDIDCIFVGADSIVVNQIGVILDVSERVKIPVFTTDEGSIEQGAFAGLSVDYKKFGKKTAQLVSKVIKAGTASNMNGEKYIGEEIIINANSACKIRLTLNPCLVKEAFRIIK